MDLDLRPVSQKWFDESVPTNFAESTCTIGSGTDGSVVITKNDFSAEDGGYTTTVVVPTSFGNLSSVLVGKVLTVTLETSNSTAAGSTLGTEEHGLITITADTAGAAGNSYTIAVVKGSASGAMSAAISEKDITVTLGMTDATEPDATKNTAVLIASAIDELDGVSATASGNGEDAITAEVPKKSFIGGADIALSAVKNTASNVAESITALSEFTAVASGEGTSALTSGETVAFEDGTWGTPCPQAGITLDCTSVDRYYYTCIKSDNTRLNNGWRKYIPATF